MHDLDIHALDLLEPGQDEAEAEFDRYRRALVDLFRASPEGEGLHNRQGSAGFWAGCLLDFGFNHLGVLLPSMALSDLEEIVTGYFPRKVSLRSPEEAEGAIPELIAFWEFLGREFALGLAQTALRWLKEIQPSFTSIMNDPSRFGMAKSMLMKGQAAGFDMSDPAQMNVFFAAYNARVAAEHQDPSEAHSPSFARPDADSRVKRIRARTLRKRIAKGWKKKPGQGPA